MKNNKIIYIKEKTINKLLSRNKFTKKIENMIKEIEEYRKKTKDINIGQY